MPAADQLVLRKTDLELSYQKKIDEVIMFDLQLRNNEIRLEDQAMSGSWIWWNDRYDLRSSLILFQTKSSSGYKRYIYRQRREENSRKVCIMVVYNVGAFLGLKITTLNVFFLTHGVKETSLSWSHDWTLAWWYPLRASNEIMENEPQELLMSSILLTQRRMGHSKLRVILFRGL